MRRRRDVGGSSGTASCNHPVNVIDGMAHNGSTLFLKNTFTDSCISTASCGFLLRDIFARRRRDVRGSSGRSFSIQCVNEQMELMLSNAVICPATTSCFFATATDGFVRRRQDVRGASISPSSLLLLETCLLFGSGLVTETHSSLVRDRIVSAPAPRCRKDM